MAYPTTIPVRLFKEGEVAVINGKKYVPERTCRIDRRVPDAPFCSECAQDWNDDWNFCPNCGCRVKED